MDVSRTVDLGWEKKKHPIETNRRLYKKDKCISKDQETGLGTISKNYHSSLWRDGE